VNNEGYPATLWRRTQYVSAKSGSENKNSNRNMKTNLIYRIDCLLMTGMTSCKKATCWKHALLCLVLAGTATGCKQGTSVPEAKINIPATNEYFDPSGGEAGFRQMTAKERKALGIDGIKLDGINKRSGRELAVGREIWQGDEGQLSTFLVIERDHATWEYLVSRDPQGNVIDCIQTGGNLVYAGDYSYSLIAGNTVKRSSSWAEPLDAAGNGFSAVYTITDDLHFQPFAWPPAAFPCEVPFMTYEIFQTDENGKDKPFPYQFEAIVCTGVSDKKAKFTVKGKGRTDSRKAGSAERTLLLEPMNVEWEPSGEATATVFPAVNSDETFEVRVKVAIDENTFAKIQIKQKEKNRN
jgi:hypothetical protein